MKKELTDMVMKTGIGLQAKEKFNNEMFDKTVKYQEKYSFELDTGDGPTHNNESDAFKHAFMQAVLYHRASKMAPFLKNEVGEAYSKLLGDYHETETPTASNGESNMDYWNNEVGREVAKSVRGKLGKAADKLDDKYIEDLFAQEIMKKMKKGELITKPEDKRKYQDRNKYKNQNNSHKTSYNNENGHWVTI